jgi:hypothetical protein
MDAENIKRLEERAGLSPTLVAVKLKRSEQTYRRWTWRGSPRTVKAFEESLYLLRGLKTILGCSYDELIDGE